MSVPECEQGQFSTFTFWNKCAAGQYSFYGQHNSESPQQYFIKCLGTDSNKAKNALLLFFYNCVLQACSPRKMLLGRISTKKQRFNPLQKTGTVLQAILLRNDGE